MSPEKRIEAAVALAAITEEHLLSVEDCEDVQSLAQSLVLANYALNKAVLMLGMEAVKIIDSSDMYAEMSEIDKVFHRYCKPEDEFNCSDNDNSEG
jgi:hypothetical protein